MAAPAHTATMAAHPSDASPKTDVAPRKQSSGHYRGFVAGVFSGMAKLSVGHPFDTIKVRLQTAPRAQFRGPLDCVTQTIGREGWTALYKGASPPLVGWMVMDSLMLGSLTLYRRLLHEGPFREYQRLPTAGHALAGVGAGWTVSFIAAPVEHIKARLQVQYAADRQRRLYRGPIDCVRKIFGAYGVRGVYRGLSATLLFRTFFFVWWGTYDIFTRTLQAHTALSTPAINFWAGGCSAQCFWLASYPSDVVKQRLMTDPFGGRRGDGVLAPAPRSSQPQQLAGKLHDGDRKYPRWIDAARDVYRREGWRGYWRGFLPCFLRAFPANAAALVAFEAVMRGLKRNELK